LCGYCKALRPTWEALAKHVKDNKLKFHVASIDASESMDIASHYDAFPWPSIKLYVCQYRYKTAVILTDACCTDCAMASIGHCQSRATR
jgi:thiol-disulfide isomerase/thioredoxin